MFYYGFLAVGIVLIVLVLYDIIAYNWCSNNRHGREMTVNSSRSRQRSFNRNLLTTFKFKKGSTEATTATTTTTTVEECAVCLSAFEDEEEVKKLSRCEHMFHALCIDMWLYSHSDCPLCRAPVTAPEQRENSGHDLLESDDLV